MILIERKVRRQLEKLLASDDDTASAAERQRAKSDLDALRSRLGELSSVKEPSLRCRRGARAC